MQTLIVLLSIMVLSLGFIALCAMGGKDWIFVGLITLALVSSITAGKIVLVFGWAVSVATPIYAGMFLAGDILGEFYGEREAKRTIPLGLAANAFLICAGMLVNAVPTSINPVVSEALHGLFSFVPRLVFAGLLAYIVSQRVNILIYHWFAHRHGDKWLAVRNNVSTIVAQAIDTTIVYAIAFWGVVPSLIQVIATAWAVKVIVALCDTIPLFGVRFMYAKLGRLSVYTKGSHG